MWNCKRNLGCLEVQRQGTKAIRKNRRTIPIQNYEHLTQRLMSHWLIYNRFLTLLNNLFLVRKNKKMKIPNNVSFSYPWAVGDQENHYKNDNDLNTMSRHDRWGLWDAQDLWPWDVTMKNLEEQQDRNYCLDVKKNPTKVKTWDSSYLRGKEKYDKSEGETSESDFDINFDAGLMKTLLILMSWSSWLCF